MLVHFRCPSGLHCRDDIDGNLASFRIFLREYFSDLDEIAVQFALVPFGEDLLHVIGSHSKDLLHKAVGFADHLHVAVFDAVVDILTVSCAVVADPFAAGCRL